MAARVESLQFSTSPPTSRRANPTVSSTRFTNRSRPCRTSDALINPMSKRALCATRTASPINSTSESSTSSTVGALATIVSVMPVKIVMNGGIAHSGFTSVVNRPISSPPRYLTAPISVIASYSFDPPVVSRSTTQNSTSHNAGLPRVSFTSETAPPVNSKIVT